MSKILIVYYSRKGENYWNGGLKNLEKGNTERVAEFIRKAVGGDIFEVDTIKPYSESYNTCIEEAKAELRANARPEIKAYPPDFES
ncbi:MAG: flavodoxin, partial [Methanomicrobium sp.]|nr:flavodoxin [Methanomicrobium sp.]